MPARHLHKGSRPVETAVMSSGNLAAVSHRRSRGFVPPTFSMQVFATLLAVVLGAVTAVPVTLCMIHSLRGICRIMNPHDDDPSGPRWILGSTEVARFLGVEAAWDEYATRRLAAERQFLERLHPDPACGAAISESVAREAIREYGRAVVKARGVFEKAMAAFPRSKVNDEDPAWRSLAHHVRPVFPEEGIYEGFDSTGKPLGMTLVTRDGRAAAVVNQSDGCQMLCSGVPCAVVCDRRGCILEVAGDGRRSDSLPSTLRVHLNGQSFQLLVGGTDVRLEGFLLSAAVL